jgi:hypothetical protein
MAAITSSPIKSTLLALSMGVFPIAMDQLIQRVFAQKTSPLKLQAGSLMASSVAYLILAQKLPISFRIGAPVLFLVYKVALERWVKQNSLSFTSEVEADPLTPDKGQSGMVNNYQLPSSIAAATFTSITNSLSGENHIPPAPTSSAPLPPHPSATAPSTKQSEKVDQPSGSKGGAAPRKQRRIVVFHKTSVSQDGIPPQPATSAAAPSTVAETPNLSPSAVETLGKQPISLASLVTPPNLKTFSSVTDAEKIFAHQLQGAYVDAQASIAPFAKLVKQFRASEKRTIHVESSPIVPDEMRVKKPSFKANIYLGEDYLFKFDKVRVDALKAAGYTVTEETLFFWIEVKKTGEEKKLTTMNLIPLEMLKNVKSDTQKFSLTLKEKDTNYVLNFDNQMSKLKSFAATMRKCTQIYVVPEALVNLTLSLKSPSSTKHQETVIEANDYATVHHAKCYLEPFMPKV